VARLTWPGDHEWIYLTLEMRADRIAVNDSEEEEEDDGASLDSDDPESQGGRRP